MLKFQVPGGILTLRSSKIIPLECIMVSKPKAQPSDIIQAVEERIKVAIHPEYPEQTIAIGSTLTEEGWKALCDLLRRSLDVFSWKPADMTGVSRHIAEHKLNVHEGCLPVRQKKRSQALERNKAIQEEVEKLVDADIMKKVHYHSCYQYGNTPREGPKPFSVRPSTKLGQRSDLFKSNTHDLHLHQSFPAKVENVVIQDLEILQASQELSDLIKA
ncbi:hypothetical protein Tco_0059132 [Tanacetum coccineum]